MMQTGNAEWSIPDMETGDMSITSLAVGIAVLVGGAFTVYVRKRKPAWSAPWQFFCLGIIALALVQHIVRLIG